MIEQDVQKIIRAVAQKGDAALIAYTKKFDGHVLSRRSLEVTSQERRNAWKKVDRSLVSSLQEAAKRIRRFHERQLQSSWEYSGKGLQMGLRWSAMERVGIYVPGGRASYPSSVLMNAIPAKVAGVRNIIMTTPYTQGIGNPATLVAADIAGVDRIFKVGGAQAIAALAYGTKKVPRVDKIVGPGNRYVAEAKRQVFGRVAIDMIAGPSELLVIADDSANPAWVAADLIAQAEHDPDAIPVVISPSSKFLQNVRREMKIQTEKAPRRKIIEQALKSQGHLIKVRNLAEACDRANQIAPEHLSLVVRQPQKIFARIQHAGAVFMGPYSAVALGDYGVGPNHVLPTGGSARFSSPLGVYDFQKATSFLQIDKFSLKKVGRSITDLAKTEGLLAHAASVQIRLRD